MTDALDLAGGQSSTCALRKDKTVSCWGANYDGQLGDGLKANERLTVEPVQKLGGVASISAAKSHACAVLENGEVVCWGNSTCGQAGGSAEPGKACEKPIVVSPTTIVT